MIHSTMTILLKQSLQAQDNQTHWSLNIKSEMIKEKLSILGRFKEVIQRNKLKELLEHSFKI
jgi:hypothetical protein